jgi:hypothetical protein
MYAQLYTAILEDEVQQTLEYDGKTAQDIIFSRTMTLSTPPN